MRRNKSDKIYLLDISLRSKGAHPKLNFWFRPCPRGYRRMIHKTYSLSILIDIGAIISSRRWNALPLEKMDAYEESYYIAVKGIDAKETIREYKEKNISIWMNKNKFVIPKILFFPNMHGDILLGNNFINNYLPMQIHHKYIALTLQNELVTVH
jgi:hypothetical protein